MQEPTLEQLQAEYGRIIYQLEALQQHGQQVKAQITEKIKASNGVNPLQEKEKVENKK